MANIFIALGTNLGDRHRNLNAAITALGANIIIDKKSNIYETDPMYVTDQPAFLNMVISGITDFTPRQSLIFFKTIEEKLGRKQTFKNGPRVIDLDILYYDFSLHDDDDLTIPHPRISERDFVLRPMADIAKDFIDPRTKKTITQMLINLDNPTS